MAAQQAGDGSAGVEPSTGSQGEDSAGEPGLGGGAEPGPVALHLPAGIHQLCGCGRSRHGWFCDGAHLGTGRVSHELRLEQATTVLLCGCGRSRGYPLCDGSHALPVRRRWWRFGR